MNERKSCEISIDMVLNNNFIIIANNCKYKRLVFERYVPHYHVVEAVVIIVLLYIFHLHYLHMEFCLQVLRQNINEPRIVIKNIINWMCLSIFIKCLNFCSQTSLPIKIH